MILGYKFSAEQTYLHHFRDLIDGLLETQLGRFVRSNVGEDFLRRRDQVAQLRHQEDLRYTRMQAILEKYASHIRKMQHKWTPHLDKGGDDGWIVDGSNLQCQMCVPQEMRPGNTGAAP